MVERPFVVITPPTAQRRFQVVGPDGYCTDHRDERRALARARLLNDVWQMATRAVRAEVSRG